jgi:hypothetical protein
MQHDLAESIFKDEPKKKIIVISGKGSLWTSKTSD